MAAFRQGRELKVAIRGLCDDLAADGEAPLTHEVFVHVGAVYWYSVSRLLCASANPVVRTRASIPLGYSSGAWDFGFLMPRTDGHLARWLCDPYTLEFRKSQCCCPMRWFASL